jgi:hypothetical protein
LSLTRQYLRGWNADRVSEDKKRKKTILEQPTELEQISEQQIVQGHWKGRYKLEAQVEHIYQAEEIYWQQRIMRIGFSREMSILHFFMLLPMGEEGK